MRLNPGALGAYGALRSGGGRLGAEAAQGRLGMGPRREGARPLSNFGPISFRRRRNWWELGDIPPEKSPGLAKPS
jgi:hypothetical protein